MHWKDTFTLSHFVVCSWVLQVSWSFLSVVVKQVWHWQICSVCRCVLHFCKTHESQQVDHPSVWQVKIALQCSLHQNLESLQTSGSVTWAWMCFHLLWFSVLSFMQILPFVVLALALTSIDSTAFFVVVIKRHFYWDWLARRWNLHAFYPKQIWKLESLILLIQEPHCSRILLADDKMSVSKTVGIQPW